MKYNPWCILFLILEFVLIYNIDNEEHDAIPARWLINDDMAWYPDKAKSSTKKLAKSNAAILNESDWPKIKINIIKRGYYKYKKLSLSIGHKFTFFFARR
jgi:hypothetical protein